MIIYSWLIINGDIIVDVGIIFFEVVFCDVIYGSFLFVNFVGVSFFIVKRRFDFYYLIKMMNRF